MQPQQGPPQGPEITIKLLPDGKGVSVTGPFQMPALCYGMLQMAHDAIQENLSDARKRSGLQVAHGGDVPPIPATSPARRKKA